MPHTTKEQAQSNAADPVSVELTPYDLVQLSYLVRENWHKARDNANKWAHYVNAEPEILAHMEFYTFWKGEADYFSELLGLIEFYINPQNRKQ